ncbi:MAG: hypothetical protein Q8K60_02110, partial [Parachlamydiaceae bacterium]|nr:hypothetical protein [Parachlamydiaceae bacterium]
NNVIPSIFSKDDDPITFTIRELYQAAHKGEGRAKALVEYLGEMYHDIFLRLDELDVGSFSSDDQNLDRQYTLPIEHFTQKMLDETLWHIDTTETGLEGLFHPQPIQTGATYEVIKALKKVINDEKDEPYFTEKEGQCILERISTEAVGILEEKIKTIQTFESEKTEFEQIISKLDIATKEVTEKFEQTQEENSKLTETLQEKEIALENGLQRETNVIAVKEQLEIKLTDIEQKYSKLQAEHDETLSSLADTEQKYSMLKAEHDETLSALKNSNNELEALKKKNLAYEEKMRQASAMLNLQ